MTVRGSGGFTMVEAVVAVGVIGVAFTSCLGALALMNSIASISRNYTGAYVALERRIDWALTAAPFNPQSNQFPREDHSDGSYVKLDPTDKYPSTNPPGTYTEANVPVYNEAQAGFVNGVSGLLQLLTNPPTPNVEFTGTMTTTVVDVSPTPNAPPYIYSVTVTVSYQYRGRGPIWSPTRNRWEYQLSMSTLRTSDT
jgi:type II secretory pathway pseudopilin PulG